MGGINVKRWFAGGIAAGVLIWIFEGVASVFYLEEMMAAMEAHNLSMEMTAGTWALTVVMSLLAGLIAERLADAGLQAVDHHRARGARCLDGEGLHKVLHQAAHGRVAHALGRNPLQVFEHVDGH